MFNFIELKILPDAKTKPLLEILLNDCLYFIKIHIVKNFYNIKKKRYAENNIVLTVLCWQEIFGPETEYELIPGETPVEQLSVNGQNRHERDTGK